jgi:hypothetical protein
MSNLEKFNLSYSLFSTMKKHAQLSASVLKEFKKKLNFFKDYIIFNAKLPKKIAKETNIDVKIKDKFDECKIERLVLLRKK